jgi:CheY-like chemotaxis protein
MRFEAITIRLLRRAIRLYLDEAYRDAPVPPPPVIDAADDAPVAEHLRLFMDETTKSPHGIRSYALRLGNRRYPFMKLLLREQLVRGEFFFSVDTHDQMFRDTADPELERLKVFNRETKERIEAAWEGAGLPTTVNLRGLCEGMPIEREPAKGVRVLVVDDDAAILDTISMLLEVKGYAVDRACNGRDALDRLDPERHDLVLMDVEMPRMSGFEACQAIKSDPRLSGIPVLLASAGAVELARSASPDAFLVKPFPPDALFLFLESLLEQARRRAPASR